MKRDEAVAKWRQACHAEPTKGGYVRNGRWVDTAHALRHADCEHASLTEIAYDGSTILKVEPAPVPADKVPPGKSAIKRPAFYLFVL